MIDDKPRREPRPAPSAETLERVAYNGPRTAGELLALLVSRYAFKGNAMSGADMLIEAVHAMYGGTYSEAIERAGDMVTDAMIARG